MRFVSRVTDVLHLAGPHGAGWLTHGTLALGPNEGMAWTEMARCVLAQALNALSDPDRTNDTRTDDARRLAVAFDPCVALEICTDMTNDNTAATTGVQHA